MFEVQSGEKPLTSNDILSLACIRQLFGKKDFTAQSLEEYSKLYREIRKLGEGAMGVVMLVKRHKDNQYFAAKKQSKINPADLRRSKEEFEKLLKLQHPNIVGCVESFVDDLKN